MANFAIDYRNVKSFPNIPLYIKWIYTKNQQLFLLGDQVEKLTMIGTHTALREKVCF
jgi:hypothetical protein